MIKLLSKITIMFILLAIGIGIIILIPLPNYDNFSTIIYKHRILANTKSPKIVLAGGSNLALGIDSAEIQKKLHIPVVNMGFHAGFGLGRILDDISPFLNSGDILLIAPEYGHFTSGWNGSVGAYQLIFDTRQYRLLSSPYYELPSGFLYFFSLRLMDIVDYTRASIILKFNNVSNPIDESHDFWNEYGDGVFHLGIENQPFDPNGDQGILNRTYLNYFFQLVDDFSKRGITVVLSYPSYEEQSFRNSSGLIHELDMLFRVKENLLVISTPESYCYPVNYFYNSGYHLNKEGRSVRTDQLIKDLQASGLFSTILDK